MECKDCDFYKEVGPGWVCTDEEDWRNNGDPCCRYHPNASLTLFEGVTKEAHDKLKADYAALSEENRRLREALGLLINFIPEGWPMPFGWNQVVAQARKAMEGRDGQ